MRPSKPRKLTETRFFVLKNNILFDFLQIANQDFVVFDANGVHFPKLLEHPGDGRGGGNAAKTGDFLVGHHKINQDAFFRGDAEEFLKFVELAANGAEFSVH